MSKTPDLNDKLIAGTLPVDSMRGATPGNARAKEADERAPSRIYSVKELLEDAAVRATSKIVDDGSCTTGHYELDEITGGFVPGFVWVFGADTSWGKCLGPDVDVLRYDGTVAKAKDVLPGDMLMGPDSSPRTVLSTVVGNAPMYRIVPERGDTWTCNGDHILVVVSTRTGVVTEISVDDFLLKTPTFRMQQKLFSVGIEYPNYPPVKVDPWFMGAWFGDGTKELRTIGICTPDQEIVMALNEIAATWGLNVREARKPNNKAANYSLCGKRGPGGNALLEAMREVVGDQKSLPEQYLRGNRETRLAFLAGWVDTDGYKKGDRLCEIVTQYEHWAKQLRLLARSLGIPCHLYRKTNVPGYEDRVYWRVLLTGDLSSLPTRVTRKQFPKVDSRRFTDRTGFKIEPIGVGPFNGWQLDGDGLFLLSDLTVTHNTSFFISATDENIKRGKRVLIVSAEDPPSLYGDRLLARRAQVSASRLRKRQLEEDEIKRVREVQSKGEDVPVYIQAGNKPIETLAKEITAIMRLEGINMVVFDYLQEFRSSAKHQDERTRFKHTSAVMRDLIRSNNRCGAILSQLTIGSDTKIPNKHNIRESRDVSNAAEVIGIGFSPDADITKPPERDVNGRPMQAEPIFQAGKKYVLIDKNKNGANGRKVEMRWNEHSACFDTVKDPEQERLERQSQEWDDTIGAEYDDFK